MYAPSIMTYQALEFLDIRRVLKNFLRRRKIGSFIELAAGTAVLYTLPLRVFLDLAKSQGGASSRSASDGGDRGLRAVVSVLLRSRVLPWLTAAGTDGETPEA